MQTLANEVGALVYETLGLDPLESPRGGAVELAERLLGSDALYPSPNANADASVSVLGGRTRIVLRTDLPPRRANFLIAQMVARVVLRDMSVDVSEIALAASLVAPEAACRRVLSLGGLSAVPDAFAITWTSAAMRVGEIDPDEGSIVTTPSRVHRRGRMLHWMSDEDVRAMAERPRAKALRRVVLPDEPHRIALLPKVA